MVAFLNELMSNKENNKRSVLHEFGDSLGVSTASMLKTKQAVNEIASLEELEGRARLVKI